MEAIRIFDIADIPELEDDTKRGVALHISDEVLRNQTVAFIFYNSYRVRIVFFEAGCSSRLFH